MNRTWILLPLLLTMTGCSKVDSAELATGAIDLSVTVRASGHLDTEASALLKDGFDDVVLTGGDRLTLSTDLDPERDFERGTLGVYHAAFDPDASEATVALKRPDAESAESTVDIPERLMLDTPLEGASLSLTGGDVAVTWSNPVDDAKVGIWTFACGTISGGLGLYPEDPPDTGSITLSPSELGAAGDCISIVISRTVAGSSDPALHEDSSIEGERDEQFDVMLVP